MQCVNTFLCRVIYRLPQLEMSTPKYEQPKAAIHNALKKLRIARGVNQAELAPVISRRHVIRIEQGRQLPSIQMIESLAKGLHIHPMTLLAVAYSPHFQVSAVEKLLDEIRMDVLKLLPADSD